jgi:hypothetical protein
MQPYELHQCAFSTTGCRNTWSQANRHAYAKPGKYAVHITLGLLNMLPAYHRVLDFFLRRIFAVSAIILGTVIALVDLPSLLPGGTFANNGVPTDSWFWRIFAVLFPLLFVILGIALFRAKPFKPWRGLH